MPKKITWLRLTEGSTVDVPAQEHAKFVLFKRGKVKTESDGAHPASHYAFVPDPDMPSTWKLRIDDASHVAAAAAALGPGYRGNKVQIPSGDIAAVRAKVRAAWHKFFPDRPDDEMPSGLKGKSAGGHPRGDMMEDHEKQLADLQKRLDTLKSQVTTMSSAIDAAGFKLDGEKLVEKTEDDIYKGVPEAIRKQMEADKAEREQLRKQLADAKDREETAVLKAQAGKLEKLSAKPEEVVDLLKKLDSEGRDSLMRILRSADELVGKGAEILQKGNGQDGEPAEDDPVAKVMVMVQELRKSNADMSDAQAKSEVFSKHPELYTAYRDATEVRVATRR